MSTWPSGRAMIRCRAQTFSNSVRGAFVVSMSASRPSDSGSDPSSQPYAIHSSVEARGPDLALVDLLGAGEPHDLTVPVDLGKYELLEVLRRPGAGHRGQLGHAAPHVVGLEDGGDLRIQPVDDLP